jgi:hypothetical protein
MSNWLEAEERKLEARRRELLLLSEREETVHKHLETFYDLCERVNGVRYNSLSIDRLKVECTRSHQTKTDGYQSFHTVDERRGIHISCPNQDETFIDVVIKKHSRNVYWNDDVPPADYASDEERVVVRNTCTLQELIDWREDQIIELIQWMLLESEVIKGSIPGKEIRNELAEAEAKKAAAKRLESEALAARALAEVRQEIAVQKAAIARGWKELGIAVAILAGVILLYRVCAYFADPRNANPTPQSIPDILGSMLRAVFGAVSVLGGLVFGLATLVGIVVVLGMALNQIVKTTAGKARIADLESEGTSSPPRKRVLSNREAGYFLETLRKANKANKALSGSSPIEVTIAYLKVPIAAVKSIVALPGRISRRSRGE